jgi:membrane protein
VIVLKLWFYVSGLAVLIGAELNAEIEHASPSGKEPGERVPGEEKKIGAVAERPWRSARRPPR